MGVKAFIELWDVGCLGQVQHMYYSFCPLCSTGKRFPHGNAFRNFNPFQASGYTLHEIIFGSVQYLVNKIIKRIQEWMFTVWGFFITWRNLRYGTPRYKGTNSMSIAKYFFKFQIIGVLTPVKTQILTETLFHDKAALNHCLIQTNRH